MVFPFLSLVIWVFVGLFFFLLCFFSLLIRTHESYVPAVFSNLEGLFAILTSWLSIISLGQMSVFFLLEVFCMYFSTMFWLASCCASILSPFQWISFFSLMPEEFLLFLTFPLFIPLFLSPLFFFLLFVFFIFKIS